MRVHLELPDRTQEEEFLASVGRSRALHGQLVTPPKTRLEYRAYMRRSRLPAQRSYLIRIVGGGLAGVINISEIVLGRFRSGYLGYYAFCPYDGKGCMTAGLRLVIARAFRVERLHRLEANIQPRNVRSIALVKRLGFRLEGFSPRYLKLGGRWQDHERWALTIEDWKLDRRTR